MRVVALALLGAALAGCAAVNETTPASQIASSSPWAIERMVERCRATQAGGTRVGTATAGPVTVGVGIAAVATRTTPETAECPLVLLLSDQDVVEIRILVQNVAATGRGLDTNWESAAGQRREIALSVYPDAANSDCRVVAATMTIFARPALPGPTALMLDEQRMCRDGEEWRPKG